MLSTTLLQARSVSSRTRHTPNRSCAPSSSTLQLTSRSHAQGAPTARLFHSQGPSNEVIRASVPRIPDCFSIIAHALDPGKTVWFKRLPLYNLTVCLAPPLSCARGGFQATRKQPVYATDIIYWYVQCA